MVTRIDLLGVRVSALTLSGAVDEMARMIADGQRGYACTCPVYTLMQGHDRPDVRAALAGAALVTADGMPVVWAQRLFGARGAGRVYGPDLLLAFSERSAREGYRQFYLGGAPGVADELARRLAARFPGLPLAGTFCPPFREMTPDEGRAMLAAVNAARADVVWVGLGSPRQDLWMARYRERLDAPLLVGVGAAFDFLTGRQPQAPRWTQRAGLEWLFRLASEPRRLWRRYLIYNPRFVGAIARQWLAQRAAGRATTPPTARG